MALRDGSANRLSYLSISAGGDAGGGLPLGRVLSLPEQIAERVGRRILGGDIPPGARITEQELVDEIGVSRAPVREAFRILERDGLIRIHPRRGVIATPLSRKDFGDIVEIGLALWTVMGQHLAQARSQAAIDLLEREIPELERAAKQPKPAAAFTEIASRLRLGLVHATGNSRLEAMLRSLALESYRYRALAQESQALRLKAVGQWRKLLIAIRQGNSKLAAKSIALLVEGNRHLALDKLSHEEDQDAEESA